MIIADNLDEKSEFIYMADDGNGHTIHTPAFFISKFEGSLLK